MAWLRSMAAAGGGGSGTPYVSNVTKLATASSYTLTQADIDNGDYIVIITSGWQNEISCSFDGTGMLQSSDTSDNIRLNTCIIPCTEQNIGKTFTRSGSGIIRTDIVRLNVTDNSSPITSILLSNRGTGNNSDITTSYQLTQEDNNAKYILFVVGVAGRSGSSSGIIKGVRFTGNLGTQIAFYNPNGAQEAGFAAYMISCNTYNISKTIAPVGFSVYTYNVLKLS